MATKRQVVTRKQKRLRKEHDGMVAFMSSPKPHVFDPSGLGGCIRCGRTNKDGIHIRSHAYQPNHNSRLLRCMCGENRQHPIHVKRGCQ